MLLFFMVIVGLILRLWSYFSLGSYFTLNIGIRRRHTLIQTGPYQYLVHPGYTGAQLVIYSAFLLVRASAMTFLLLISLSIYELNLLYLEQEVLREYFGLRYDKYLEKRAHFLPYII
jgi:protein-S-isoprenylcysteine O-methyltransferase Ste14